MTVRQQVDGKWESMQSWAERTSEEAIARHHAERVAGKHDEQCEWRHYPGELNGFHLCGCHTRARITKGFVEPPELVYQLPYCSNCLNEVDHDGDNFVCYPCGVSWSGRGAGTDGSFINNSPDLSAELEHWLELRKAKLA